MQKFVIFIGLFLIGTSSSYCANEEWSDAYSRRNFKLGISISEFKAIKHPDQTEWPNAKPVCSNERAREDVFLSELKTFDVDPRAKHGVIMCEHAWRSPGSNYLSTAGLVLGKTNSGTAYYFKAPRVGEEPVLYHITSGGRTSNFSYIFAAFQQKYGEPNQYLEQELQNGLGATFTNQIAVYENKSSKIVLKRFSRNLRTFKIDFSLTDIMSELDQLVEKTEGSAADKL